MTSPRGEAMPAMEREAVADWLLAISLSSPNHEYKHPAQARERALIVADAVIALVEAKVREAISEYEGSHRMVRDHLGALVSRRPLIRDVVSRVMGRSPGL